MSQGNLVLISHLNKSGCADYLLLSVKAMHGVLLCVGICLSFLEPEESGTIVILILKMMRGWKLRMGIWLAQGHTAKRQQDRDLN